ncbi:MAG: trehalose operon repressor [Turicibacter sp.]
MSIYNDIVSEIESGTYQANDLLPSEKTLINSYDVSRDTIRKSLNMLEQNGYIQKIKGKGSFVLDRTKVNFQVSGVISFKEVSTKLGRNSQTRVEVLECKYPSDKMSKNLELESTDKVWKVVRSRAIDGEKVILDKDYFVADIIEDLPMSACQDSIYEYIEKELGLTIAYAKKEITVQMATEEDKKYLDMKNFEMIAVVKSFTYLDNNKLFQYTESRHRPDKFMFIDFARRIVQ